MLVGQSFRFEIVADEFGVDFSVKSGDGESSTLIDLDMLQLEVSTSGYRLVVNSLNGKGKKRAESMFAQLGVVGPNEPITPPMMAARNGQYL